MYQWGLNNDLKFVGNMRSGFVGNSTTLLEQWLLAGEPRWLWGEAPFWASMQRLIRRGKKIYKLQYHHQSANAIVAMLPLDLPTSACHSRRPRKTVRNWVQIRRRLASFTLVKICLEPIVRLIWTNLMTDGSMPTDFVWSLPKGKTFQRTKIGS